MSAQCKMLNAECCQGGPPAPRPASLVPRSPSRAPRPRTSRRGISLLEILVSLFVLAGGLLAVAALIPLGGLSLLETERSDRTGACGRAAIREVRIRGMVNGVTNVVAIDPIGYHSFLYSSNVEPLGGKTGTNKSAIQRLALTWVPDITAAQEIFGWHDDLIFTRPEEITGTTIPAGTRPVDQSFGPEDNYSWFLTVVPGAANGPHLVSVVVCQKRILTHTSGNPDREALSFENVRVTGGIGGASIEIPGDWPANWKLKKNDWILLDNPVQRATWYRVVHAGYDQANTKTYVSLVGPDWRGGNGAVDKITAISVEGVTGVYTTTVYVN